MGVNVSAQLPLLVISARIHSLEHFLTRLPMCHYNCGLLAGCRVHDKQLLQVLHYSRGVEHGQLGVSLVHVLVGLGQLHHVVVAPAVEPPVPGDGQRVPVSADNLLDNGGLPLGVDGELDFLGSMEPILLEGSHSRPVLGSAAALPERVIAHAVNLPLLGEDEDVVIASCDHLDLVDGDLLGAIRHQDLGLDLDLLAQEDLSRLPFARVYLDLEEVELPLFTDNEHPVDGEGHLLRLDPSRQRSHLLHVGSIPIWLALHLHRRQLGLLADVELAI
mmetsp:Transcript_4812/g.8251  ORF Transcript_4812/g.8251 Transcript_4812/m.8251 type:complete len:275 (-) Transcript_4812:596-1420(-)